MCAICFGVVTTGLTTASTISSKIPFSNKLKKIFTHRNIYIFVLIVLGLFAFLPVLAPILRKLQINFLADIIYNIYFIFCHQRASHSFHIFDYQFAYCARDTFIWSTVFLITLIRFKYHFKPLKWYWFIVLTIPIALDGGLQFIAIFHSIANTTSPFYESTNLSRAITGSLFGIAVGGSLIAYLMDSTAPFWQIERKEIKQRNAILLTLFFVLLSFLALYSAELSTSPKYPPKAVFESAPRYYDYSFVQEPRLLHSK